jgi:rhodanese-related sulfurtransferase
MAPADRTGRVGGRRFGGVPTQVFTVREVDELLRNGAQLVDVLEPESYALDHIPGAINLWLKRLTAESAAILDKARPVIVYCNDFG